MKDVVRRGHSVPVDPVSRGPRTSWETLEEILPEGTGQCIDIGCGDAKHREVIERAGYGWVGVDLKARAGVVQADVHDLPFEDQHFAAAVLWLSLQYFERPWIALREVARVLQAGGLLVGSVAFLEPFHNTYFGYTHWGLERILNDSGFEAVEVLPGVNCASLVAWTLASRVAGGRAAAPAFRITNAVLRSSTLVYPAVRALALRLLGGREGDLSDSYWMKRAPLEFAGHLMFRARRVAE